MIVLQARVSADQLLWVFAVADAPEPRDYRKITARYRTHDLLDGECSICMVSLVNARRRRLRLPCAHTFHSLCIEKWLAQSLTCPLCRQDIPE